MQKMLKCHTSNRPMSRLGALSLALLAILATCTACRSPKTPSPLIRQEEQPLLLKHGELANATAVFDKEVTWTLRSLKTKRARYSKEQPKATLRFNPETSIMSGSTSCNDFSANYLDNGNGNISIGEIITTKVACPENYMELERSFLSLLGKANGYVIGEYELQLLQDGNVILSFSRED